MMDLAGTPSVNLPDVLATGIGDVGYAFISLSAREPAGRDAEYLEWHSLDHRPEQYRLPELRNSLRLVSTPACRAARAASTEAYDRVDHVMTYMFSDAGGMKGFNALGGALDRGDRMPLRLPSIGYMTADLAGKYATARAVAGADVIPWRPAIGVYLIIEEGKAPPTDLVDLPHVAGNWWFDGNETPPPHAADARGLRITYCYLDGDPLAAAEALRAPLLRRWQSGVARGLLAAPFFAVVPFEWDRHLP